MAEVYCKHHTFMTLQRSHMLTLPHIPHAHLHKSHIGSDTYNLTPCWIIIIASTQCLVNKKYIYKIVVRAKHQFGTVLMNTLDL